MKCKRCEQKAVIGSPRYCKDHFIAYFEEKVSFTIKRHGLMRKKDRVAVAVSGGKDSMSLLFLLNKLRYNVMAIAVDEGIAGYRDRTLDHMKRFCEEKRIAYKAISYKEVFGKTLDEIVKDKQILPCSVCGVFRRRILNDHTNMFDVIATGHNMDDEAQAIIMNLTKSNIVLLSRLGPVSGEGAKKVFTKRVKPFYFCSEKEIMVYSILNRLNALFEECPHVKKSFRLRIRDIMNEIEYKEFGTKRNVIDSFLMVKKKLIIKKDLVGICLVCKEPSASAVCCTCNYMKMINPTNI